MTSSITIVTAFFDIGRGNWTTENGYSPYFHRTSQTYLDYFKNLATLENDMVIFTSKEFEDKIRKIRGERPTKIIVMNPVKRLIKLREKIKKIQDSDKFKSLLNKEQSISPEYFSPDYILVCNLKSYFVSKAINLELVKTESVAWVDFGYCRDLKTLNNIVRWDYHFPEEKINFFTIKKGLKVNSLDDVFDKMLNNDVYIIGGAIVGKKEKWNEFSRLVWACQRLTLKRKMIDDDQGIFIMCYYKRNDLIKLNYLGKNNWFYLFKKYNHSQLMLWYIKIKLIIFSKLGNNTENKKSLNS
ncbi:MULTISPECIES: protein YibB [Pectobacterium]|uniref:protein YibB n=1 Tax=Pectobacterium TaxID=122277 RepID=UPI001968CD5D|nr:MULTISPECIES: protein YibB [Pectobacterium]MBN3135168.1 protein YibB [Pectobacterium punjabense]MCE5379386.1 protein YibB [Pectobacterium punjabense]MCE9731507.1 hypothetical protein [Pectobacterium sp. IFB5596]